MSERFELSIVLDPRATELAWLSSARGLESLEHHRRR